MLGVLKKLLFLFIIIIFLQLEVFAQSDQLIPGDFATYTYEDLFSISYPNNWEPALSIIDSIKQEVDTYLKSIGDKGFSDEQLIFMAGVPLGGGYYNPNINITIKQSGIQKTNLKLLNDIAESTKKLYEETTEEYNLISQTIETIDGKQALLLENRARLPNQPFSSHFLQTFLFGGGFAWIITCSVVPPLSFNTYKDDIYTVARSLKILSKSPEPEGFFEGIFDNINIGESLAKGLISGLSFLLLYATYLIFKKIFSLFSKKS
jgi:hypothetical protein